MTADVAANRGRLTDVERAERKITGGELQRQIADLAEFLGWDWMEVGPLRTQHGWRTPTRGTLGAGWPDLVLVRRRDRRLIFAELKRELEQPRPDQVEVLDILGSLRTSPLDGPMIEVFVWRPSDLRDRDEPDLRGAPVKPVRTARSNMVYVGPTPDIGDLHCQREEPGQILSVWWFTPAERQLIALGANVALRILGEPIPPVSLEVTDEQGVGEDAPGVLTRLEVVRG